MSGMYMFSSHLLCVTEFQAIAMFNNLQWSVYIRKCKMHKPLLKCIK